MSKCVELLSTLLLSFHTPAELKLKRLYNIQKKLANIQLNYAKSKLIYDMVSLKIHSIPVHKYVYYSVITMPYGLVVTR